jgi:hypothetical protein
MEARRTYRLRSVSVQNRVPYEQIPKATQKRLSPPNDQNSQPATLASSAMRKRQTEQAPNAPPKLFPKPFPSLKNATLANPSTHAPNPVNQGLSARKPIRVPNPPHTHTLTPIPSTTALPASATPSPQTLTRIPVCGDPSNRLQFATSLAT